MKLKIFIAVAVFILITNFVYASKTIIVSGHPEYPPVMWQEGDDIIGVGTEITKMVFEELGITVDSKFKGSWLKVQKGINEGSIDALVGIYMTEQNKKNMYYSIPYMKDPVVIFVAKDKTFPYKKWDDLIGKKGTIIIGESYGKEFDKFIAAKLTISRSVKTEESFNKLLSGEVDYFVFAMYSGLIEAERLGIANRVEYLPAYVVSENFYITIAKESKLVRYLPQINKKIEKLVKDGTVDKLIDDKMKYYIEGIKGKR